jgi:hypothetical protein
MIRKITLGITLLFSTLMFASPAYADWESILDNVGGTTFYVDFDRIRTNGGYVYWWELQDYSEPQNQGLFSTKVYKQGDCEMFRFKNLSWNFHKQPMGEGTPFNTDSTPDTIWNYPPPNTVVEYILKIACHSAGL